MCNCTVCAGSCADPCRLLYGYGQPLAESIAELGGAHNAYQARDIARGLILTLVRYLLAMNARHRAGTADPALLALLRAMNQRVPCIDNRIRLLRLLVHRLAGRAGAARTGDATWPSISPRLWRSTV